MTEPVALAFAPGIHTNSTDRSARGRWKDCDHVRFHQRLPEKLGGWQSNNAIAFDGICRALIGWESLVLKPYVAAGTHTKLYIVTGEDFNNVTPLQQTGASLGTDPFAVVSGSPIVTVTDASHDAIAGDTVIYSGATAGGGITIDGEYTIDSITSASVYVITHSSNATSTDSSTGGASVTADYEINIGVTDTAPNTGWGSGGWGISTWGTPRASTAILERAAVWSLDTWGEDLLAARRDGTIYVWDTSAGIGTRAVEVTNAPATVKVIKVSDQRILIAFGAHDGSADNAMNVRWTDEEDYTDWTATTTNAAGDKLLDRGSEIIGVASIRGGFLILTDQAAYRMTWVGGNVVFAFQVIAEGAGMLISPNAMIERDGLVYFMGSRDFFIYDGTIRVLPCEVWKTVFGDFNDDQGFKVYGGHNEIFNELWWHYSTEGASENDAYVIYNYIDNTWVFGSMVRTAWIDSPALYGVPIATDASGTLHLHEVGTEADNSALEYHLESYDAEIDPSFRFFNVTRLIPDYETLEGEHSVKIKSRRRPQGAQTSSTAKTFTSATEEIDIRSERGRQAALYLSSANENTHFRMGPWLAEIRERGQQ